MDSNRRVNTVPVKLGIAKNTFHKDNPDSKFTALTTSNLNKLESFLWSDYVAIINQYDKCLVLIGITTEKSQKPILMIMKYIVVLPDHDWIVDV